MGQIASASKNEVGSYKTGVPGDQTGQEVKLQNWYYGNWNCVIRPNDAQLGKKAAAIAVKLAKSPLVGYSQNTRKSLFDALKKNNWNVDAYLASGEKTNCDCSSFVHAIYCCLIPGPRSMSWPPTTGTLPSVMPPHGFTVIRDASYYKSSSKLIPGDIIDCTSTHVVIYIGDENALPSDTSGGGGTSGGTVTQVQFSPEDSILREVGYLTNDLVPSIKASKTLLSLYNTAIFQQILEESGGGGGTSYNIDKLTGNCRTVVKFLLDKGLNLAGAIGIAANIQRESGFRTDAVNSSSGASGICQWLGGRRTQMINHCGGNWRNNLTGQLEYFWQEINTAYYKHVLDHVKAVQDTLAGAKQAMDYFMRHFEVCGNYAFEYTQRGKFVEEMWSKCSIIQKPSGGGGGSTNGVIPPGNPSRTVEVPSSVNQSGLIPNYTNYGYWFSRWGYTQRKIADEWARTGKNHIEYVASIAGYRLLACSTVFGTTGDLIKVNLQDGTSFGAIIADSKGGDAGSKWGHYIGGKVDIIEWEMAGTSAKAVDSATQGKMKLTGLRNKKVKSISNYGQYKKW